MPLISPKTTFYSIQLLIFVLQNMKMKNHIRGVVQDFNVRRCDVPMMLGIHD